MSAIIGQVIERCCNVRNVANSILTHGTTKEEHDKRKTSRSTPTKSIVCITELGYYGCHISTLGVFPDKDCIQSRNQAHAAAKHSHGSKKLSGIIKLNTVPRFLPNLAAMTEPIRRITHKDCPWSWGPEQSEAFNQLGDLMSRDTVLPHFDPSLPTQVCHDTCKVGISGTLTQKYPDGSIWPVAYSCMQSIAFQTA